MRPEYEKLLLEKSLIKDRLLSGEEEEWSQVFEEVELTEEELSSPEWQEALKYLAEH